MGDLWNELCTYKALKDGWYLAIRDLQQDFIEIPFLKEQFASSLDANLKELMGSERFQLRAYPPSVRFHT